MCVRLHVPLSACLYMCLCVSLCVSIFQSVRVSLQMCVFMQASKKNSECLGRCECHIFNACMLSNIYSIKYR